MSNLAPCLPSVWDEWIGPSSARTLIAMECRASADLRRAFHGSNPDASHSATWPSDEEQHLFVLPVWQASGVVWLSGRAFLVGTPTGVVTHLDPNRYPNNVVLLTWSDAHVAGFREYAVEWSRVNTDKTKKLVVWTSDWVWEHVLDMFAHGDLPMSRLHVQTFDTDDIEHVEHFAPRTSMAMTYSVGSSSPELCAHFRLFDSHLIVGLDRAQENCSRPLGLLDVSTYQTLMSRIYDWYPQSRQLMARMLQRRIKQLSDASIMAPLSCARGGWWYRFSLWEGTVERVLRPECGQGSGACGPGVACSYVTEVIEVNEFAEEVSSRSIATFPCDLPSVDSGDGDACNRWNAKNFQKFADSFSIPAAAAPPDEAYKSDHDLHNLKPVSLVIGCGAPPTRWCGNINPDRRIVLGEQDVSVLECKLCQYAELRHRGSKVFSDRVWVLVSPATESVVREELARFWREYKTSLNGAEYRILRNRVVPRFETSETTGVRYFRQNDDGFQYNPAGHFDLLWCLMNEDGLEGLFYYTNLTNLGINVTDEVAVLRSHLVATEAVAVFELVLHDDTKNGMGSGSYWIRRNNGAKALIKPVYCGEEREGQGWQSDRNKVVVRDTEDSTLYMSTGSVLINAESFCSLWVELDQFPWFARPRRPLRTPSSNRIDESGWSVQLERDLDQITWVGNARCSGVVIPPPNGRRRFFAVKRERDLYQASYEELRGLYNGLPFFRAGASQTGGLPASAPPPHAPLALVPAEQHDPWGNGLLRFKKDLPRSDVQISETWESSAYPLGMSRVERNTLESIPLSDVDPELGRQMNVMSKLLDCDGNLSIQIHPSDSVCQVLRSAGLALQDDVGKEENFYVIKVAEPSVFYLGLNADKVFGTFGYRNASSETEPFTYILHRKRDKITAFATSLLSSGGEDIFLQLLQDGIEGTARRGLAGQKILDLRSEAKMPQTDPALAGILFILALRALREALSGAPSSLSGAPSSLSGAPSRKPDFNQVLLSYLNNLEKLEAGQMVRVEPGMPHAAGPGCYLVEASNQSDNTFRIFDHGREYEPEARPVHYDEAAVALCDESFLDKDKEKRHIYRLGVESTGGVVPMKILRPDTLERGDSFACQKGGAHGHTILCTEGRITISVEPQGGVPHEMTIASAHSAYLRHTAKPFKVRSVEHHTSSCAIVCSHSAEPQPELAIAIGVTHVYFVYRAYPNPPEERLFVWYEKMLFGGDFSWQRRLEVFRNELAEFLKQVCQEPRRPISLTTLSWPGPIWEKNSTRRCNQSPRFGDEGARAGLPGYNTLGAGWRHPWNQLRLLLGDVRCGCGYRRRAEGVRRKAAG